MIYVWQTWYAIRMAWKDAKLALVIAAHPPRPKAMTLNVFGLGEVAEPKSQIEVQMFKIKNEC